MSELLAGWAEAGLLDVADSLDSQRVPVNQKEREERPGFVPYYGATGQVGWIDRPLFDEELCLLGEDGAPFLDRTKQKAYVIDGPSWVNNHAHVLRALSEVTSNRFLKYALDQLDYGPHVNGTTRLKLTKNAMRRMTIPLPPKAEQPRILAGIEEQFSRLDAADEGVRAGALRLEALEAAIKRKATRPDESWRSLAFEEAFAPCSDEGRKVKQRDYLPSGRFPVVDQGERLIGGYTDDEQEVYRGPLPVLVFGDHTRRLKLIDKRFAVGADGVKLLTPKKDWEPRFALLALETIDLPNRGYSRHYQFLRKARVFRPELAEQRRIVAEVDQRLSLIDSVREAIDAAQRRSAALRRSILERAFRGELVPQDPADEPASVLLERIAAERAAEAPRRRAPRTRATMKAS